MAKVEKKMPYVTPDGITLQGKLVTDTTTGKAEWYAPAPLGGYAAYPTFVSETTDEKDNYDWVPHTDQSLDNLTKVTIPLLGKPAEKAQKYNTSGIVDLFVETDAEKLSDQIAEQMKDSNNQVFKSFNDTRVQSIEDEGSDDDKKKNLNGEDDTTPVPGATATAEEQIDALNQIKVLPDIDINDPNFSGLRYPIDIDFRTQDIIAITVLTYAKTTFNVKDGKVGFSQREFETGNTVILPIQSGIKDQNMVKWSGQEMSAFQAAAAGTSLGMATGDVKEAAAGAADALKSGGVKDAIVTSLVEKASGATGLLSRLTGAIANPNLELLFQGPELRPFSLSFFMSPRSEDEAVVVRKIIRFFKQHMAVKRGDNGIFLKSPDIFRVKYETNGGVEHGAINRFKECALVQMSVDYTPGGSYSTYNDSKHTMTAYRMDLSFQELEPIFADEYETGSRKFPKMSQRPPAIDEIGY